jgi:hypothetical protein
MELSQTIRNRSVSAAHRLSYHPDGSPLLDRAFRLPAVKSVLEAMEATGGEPTLIGIDAVTRTVTFADCAAESPMGRRSLCFDRTALDGRKQNKPVGCVSDMAASIGIELLDEADYRALQALMGPLDRKTSSWIATPSSIRAQGGALFCDHRYGQVFTYHNGADSYYASRGFRGKLTIALPAAG